MKLCHAAIDEFSNVLEYVNKLIISEWDYLELCKAAVEKFAHAIKYVEPEKVLNAKDNYPKLCKKAATKKVFKIKMVKEDFLSDRDYLLICLEAAVNGCCPEEELNHSRISREDYERLCWASVLYNPANIYNMKDPSPELCQLAVNYGANLNNIPKNR